MENTSTLSPPASLISRSPLKICIFASSNPKTSEIFCNYAYQLGQLIAQNGHICLTGAGCYGCMGSVNSGARSQGGKTMGISHELFHGGDQLIDERIICSGNDLTERRKLLLSHADIILVLPGGPGTFDELWEAAVCKILSLNNIQHKPLCVINIDGYYDGTIMQLTRAYQENLLYGTCDEYFHVENDIKHALDWSLEEYYRLQEVQRRCHGVGSAEGSNEEGVMNGTTAWTNAEGGITKKVFH